MKMMRLMEYLTGIGCILLAESTQGGAPVVIQQMIIKGELGKRLEEFKQRACRFPAVADLGVGSLREKRPRAKSMEKARQYSALVDRYS